MIRGAKTILTQVHVAQKNEINRLSWMGIYESIQAKAHLSVRTTLYTLIASRPGRGQDELIYLILFPKQMVEGLAMRPRNHLLRSPKLQRVVNFARGKRNL